VAVHSIKQNTGYFEDTMVISDLPYYTSGIIQETMEDKFNRWLSVTPCLEENHPYSTAAKRMPSNPVPD
jgi:hypothetical protein